MTQQKNIQKSKQELTAFFDWYTNERPNWGTALARIQVSKIASNCLTQSIAFCRVQLRVENKLPLTEQYEDKYTLENDTARVQKLALALHDTYASVV